MFYVFITSSSHLFYTLVFEERKNPKTRVSERHRHPLIESGEDLAHAKNTKKNLSNESMKHNNETTHEKKNDFSTKVNDATGPES